MVRIKKKTLKPDYSSEKFNFQDVKKENFSQCLECEHWGFKVGPYCKAFPDTPIPFDIRANKHDHKKPFPGDGGITFKQKKT